MHVEETLIEGNKKAKTPLILIAAVAVIKNPWVNLLKENVFIDDLKPGILDVAPELGEILTAMIVKEAGSGEKVEAYGKSAVVGLKGEIEHASGIIHTLRFGNFYREAVGAKS